MNEPQAYTNSKDSPQLELEEATNIPLLSMLSHGASTQMSFCPKTLKLRVPKFSKLKFSQL
jgi:hypothetical protein